MLFFKIKKASCYICFICCSVCSTTGTAFLKMLNQVKKNLTQNTSQDNSILFHFIALCLNFVKHKNMSHSSSPMLHMQTAAILPRIAKKNLVYKNCVNMNFYAYELPPNLENYIWKETNLWHNCDAVLWILQSLEVQYKDFPLRQVGGNRADITMVESSWLMILFFTFPERYTLCSFHIYRRGLEWSLDRLHSSLPKNPCWSNTPAKTYSFL